MAQISTLPNTPVMVALQRMLAERQADLKEVGQRVWVQHSTEPPLTPEEPHDVVLLPGTLSLTTQPHALLQALAAHLRPDGVVLGWVLGEGSFPELRDACARAGFAAPPALPAVPDVGGLLQRIPLALPVVDREFLTLTFDTPLRLLRELKAHGVLQRPVHSGCVTPRRWQQLCDAYRGRADGKFTCTLEIIFFHAVRAGAATPRAATRGSGKVSLIKILAPDEEKTCQNSAPSATLL